MEQRSRALALMIACMGIVAAQLPQPSQTIDTVWAAKMFGPAANLDHDFGVVPRGALMRHDFVMTNIFPVPVEITNIRTAWGPLRATLVERPGKHLLQPGEKATISVSLDGRRIVGPRKLSIGICTTIGPNFVSTAMLTVQANSRANVFCSGEVVFDTASGGDAPSACMEVEYVGELESWRITEVIVPKNAPFEVAVKELHRHPEGVGYQVKVTLKKDAVPRQFQHNLYLKTNEPGEPLTIVVRMTDKSAPQ